MHGYGIGMRLGQISRGAFQVYAGSLFPAFRRLERDGLIKGEWRRTLNNRRAWPFWRRRSAGRSTRRSRPQPTARRCRTILKRTGEVGRQLGLLLNVTRTFLCGSEWNFSEAPNKILPSSVGATLRSLL